MNMDVVLNDITPINDEAFITFREVKMKLYKGTYKLCFSYLNELIYLTTADIKACFQFQESI